MTLIRTKKEMYRRLRAGEFGNTNPSWMSVEEWRQSGYRGFVGIRSLIPADPFIPYVAPESVPMICVKMAGAYNISPMYRDEDYLLHGEVFRSPDWVLFYSTEPIHKRVALKDYGKHTYGLSARLIMGTFMCPNSWGDFQELTERFPDAVIEFTCLNHNAGTIPNRNTVIWEVRAY